jgi:hypothetical protein
MCVYVKELGGNGANGAFGAPLARNLARHGVLPSPSAFIRAALRHGPRLSVDVLQEAVAAGLDGESVFDVARDNGIREEQQCETFIWSVE